MESPQQAGKGGAQTPPQGEWLSRLLAKTKYGEVIMSITDGAISPGKEPRVRYSRKPRSHLRSRDAGGGAPSDRAVADLRDDITRLKGEWEVAVQVANTIPIKWDLEEVRPPRCPEAS